MWRANTALISFQQAALTGKSDFQEECLNNFANACSNTFEICFGALEMLDVRNNCYSKLRQ